MLRGVGAELLRDVARLPPLGIGVDLLPLRRAHRIVRHGDHACDRPGRLRRNGHGACQRPRRRVLSERLRRRPVRAGVPLLIQLRLKIAQIGIRRFFPLRGVEVVVYADLIIGHEGVFPVVLPASLRLLHVGLRAEVSDVVDVIIPGVAEELPLALAALGKLGIVARFENTGILSGAGRARPVIRLSVHAGENDARALRCIPALLCVFRRLCVETLRPALFCLRRSVRIGRLHGALSLHFLCDSGIEVLRTGSAFYCIGVGRRHFLLIFLLFNKCRKIAVGGSRASASSFFLIYQLFKLRHFLLLHLA